MPVETDKQLPAKRAPSWRKRSAESVKRSAVSNGARAYVVGNGNGPWARRQRDLVILYAADLGGLDMLTTGQVTLCRASAAMTIELEPMEGRWSLGETNDLDQYARVSAHLRRILETLGIDKCKPKPPKTLHEIIKESE